MYARVEAKAFFRLLSFFGRDQAGFSEAIYQNVVVEPAKVAVFSLCESSMAERLAAGPTK